MRRLVLRTSSAFLLLAALTACVSDAPSFNDNTDAGGVSCATYCQEVMRTCTGDKQQYRSEVECQAVCALLPIGTEQDKNNTVGCRLSAARGAATVDQCTAAGPYGGGVCGTRCDAFCTLIDKNCTGANAPYAAGQCAEVCPNFRFDPSVGEGPTQPFLGADNLNCRGLHAILSLGSAENQRVHCPHTAVVSSVCTAGISDAGADAKHD